MTHFVLTSIFLYDTPQTPTRTEATTTATTMGAPTTTTAAAPVPTRQVRPAKESSEL